jgi:hypothetical protein
VNRILDDEGVGAPRTALTVSPEDSWRWRSASRCSSPALAGIVAGRKAVHTLVHILLHTRFGCLRDSNGGSISLYAIA